MGGPRKSDAGVIFLPSPLWGGTGRASGQGGAVWAGMLGQRLNATSPPVSLALATLPIKGGETAPACGAQGRPQTAEAQQQQAPGRGLGRRAGGDRQVVGEQIAVGQS